MEGYYGLQLVGVCGLLKNTQSQMRQHFPRQLQAKTFLFIYF